MLPWLTIGKRLLAMIPILLGVSLLIIAATDFIPGSAADRLSTRGAMSREQIAAIEKEYGWDQPLPVRYGRFLKKLVTRGDLGRSVKTDQPVLRELIARVPATAELTLAAMAIALFFGLIIGIVAALKPASGWDYGSMFVALCGISFPVFWLGVMLQIAVHPYSGRVGALFSIKPRTGFMLIDAALCPEEGALISALAHLMLPALALATIPLAVIARMTRAAMLEVLAQDYIRTARAKGLGSWAVVVRHGLRNALIPVVTVAGLQLASLLGGAILTESVFDWPGLGKYIYEAAFNEDIPALQGAVMFVAAVFTLINLGVDVSYNFIDPRIRAEAQA